MSSGQGGDTKRTMRTRLALLASTLILTGCSLGSAPPADYTDDPAGKQVVVEVPQGATSSQIGQALLDAGVVASRGAFVDEATSNADSRKLQPGFYELTTHLSAQSALDKMLDPASRAGTRLILPEGLTVEETLQRIGEKTGADQAALEAALARTDLGVQIGPGSPEGMLAPGSYDVKPGSDPGDVLKTMIERFNLETLPTLQTSPDPYWTLIEASIVQEEAGSADEFGQVARVIDNRLKVQMPLQMDSTVNYTRKDKALHLSNQDIQADNPYNTYKVKGLTPTPIASPGLDAIKATLTPPEGDWLYFVAVGPKESLFTSSYEEFLAAKKDAQARGVY